MDDISNGLWPFSGNSFFFVVRFNGWSLSLASGTVNLVVRVSGCGGGSEGDDSCDL